MIVRRSKSSAILPLRKHLIEKTKQESQQQAAAGGARKSLDEEQLYFMQKQISASRERLMIRPIEEVMEEEQLPSSSTCSNKQSADSMEVDSGLDVTDPSQQLGLQQPHSTSGSRSGSFGTESSGSCGSTPSSSVVSSLPPSFTARLGPSGLSPLVLSEVASSGGSISSDYVTKLLPRQPLDLGLANAAAASAAAAFSSSERTGLGYDPQMQRHHCACGGDAIHPENPSRVLAIWNRLVDAGLADRCVRVARRATLEEIRSCHSETHTLVYGTDMVNRCNVTGAGTDASSAAAAAGGGGVAGGGGGTGSKMGKFCQLECGGTGVDADTYWNEIETPNAVRTAVGTLVELSQKVYNCFLVNFQKLSLCPSNIHIRMQASTPTLLLL